MKNAPAQLIIDGVRADVEESLINFEETKFKSSPKPDENCLYGLAGEFVRLIEPHTEADNMALLSQFLVYFGNIIGRSAYFQVEADKHYTNLFCLIIGVTAGGRKGTSLGQVKSSFKGIDDKHEKDSLTSGLASGEGLLWQIRDSVERTKNGQTFTEDVGASDKRLLIVEGEFAQVLKKQGTESSTLSTTIRNLWDTGTTRSLTKNSPLRTTDAHVSIIGHITQTELLSSLNEVDSANGYANRFLFFFVQRSKLLPFGSEVPPIKLGKLRDRLQSAVNFSREKKRMNFSLEASKIWAETYETLETSRAGYIAKITQRASPYVLRLACIFALLDESNLIEVPHLKAALSVWQYSEESAKYIFGNKLDNPTAERILAGLEESSEKQLERTAIRQLFNGHASKQEIDTALQYLFENNLAKFKTENTKGRPKEIWFISAKSIKSALSK